MFKKILVAYDGSNNSEKALDVGINLAKKYEAQLFTLSVIHLPDYGGTVGEIEEAKYEGKGYYEKLLADASKKALNKGIELKPKIIFGHPADTIINYLIKEKFDLVVMGPKGRSKVERFLLGSVSSKVIYHAPCKVMLVK